MPPRKTRAAAKPVATEDLFTRVANKFEKAVENVTDSDDDDVNESAFNEGVLRIYSPTCIDIYSQYNGEESNFSSLEEAEKFIDDFLKDHGGELINLGAANSYGDYGYKAKVSPDGIKVGCTTVTFDQFDQIAKAVAEVRPIPVVKKTVTRARRR